MNVAESWIKELFPKLSEQEKVFFDYIDVSPKNPSETDFFIPIKNSQLIGLFCS